MRPAGTAAALSLALIFGGITTGIANADDDRTPTRQEVRDARATAGAAATDVESIQVALTAANQRLEASTIAAQKAAEAFNGARYDAQQARKAEHKAKVSARAAAAAVVEHREAYGDAVMLSFTRGYDLDALESLVSSTGLSQLAERTATLNQAQGSFDRRALDYKAASTKAQVTKDQAVRAADDAVAAQNKAKAARDEAAAAASAAAADAASVAAEKSRLITRLATLQDISVQLAGRRQAAREARELADRQAAALAEQQATTQAPPTSTEAPAEPTPTAPVEPVEPVETTSEPTEPVETPEPTEPTEPTPVVEPTEAPSATGDGAAAVAFARAQIGEPYQWGADGPGSWDCSGLTMGAWAEGGKSLPHYSVAQYEASTPISPDDLQPGDLVFWGDSSSPSSIYHVAMYAGDGMIIHAPRTGRPVTEESMYYWITPNFYARP